MLFTPEQFAEQISSPDGWRDTFPPDTLAGLYEHAHRARIGERFVSQVLAEPADWPANWIPDNDTRAHSIEVADTVATSMESLIHTKASLRELIDRAGLTSEMFAGVTAVMGLSHDIGKWQSKQVYDLIHNGQKLTQEQRKIVADHAPIGAASFVAAEQATRQKPENSQQVSRIIAATGIDLHHNATGFSKDTAEFDRYLTTHFRYEIPADVDEVAILALADVALRLLQATDNVVARTDERRKYLKTREGLLTVEQAVDDLTRMIPMESRIDTRYTEHAAVSGAEIAGAVRNASDTLRRTT